MTAIYHPATPPTGRDDTEDGPRARRVFQCVDAVGQGGILGFASDAGVKRNKGRPGASRGPDAIRKALFGLPAPAELGAIVDFGDVVVSGDGLEAGHALLAEHVAEALHSQQRLVVLGGGHETAFGSFMGLRARFPDAVIGIINVDAHLDLRNVGAAGPSSGTPFNQIRSLEPEQFRYACLGVAREANTEALFDRACQWSVDIVHDAALLEDPTAADPVIERVVTDADLIYLTLDIDVLPHFQAPGVSAPATRGVPLTTVERIVGEVIDACSRTETPLPLMDIVEVSPPFDRDGVTAKTAAYLALRYLTPFVR
ncbi:MAG: formimidoylglutamase [Myxococcota bacterium]